MTTTIGKALRLRKTIAQTLGQITGRIQSSAVTYGDVEPDFDVNDQLERHMDEQANLRKIKMAVISKSVEAKVKISKDIPVPEADTEIPVYQAILLRDDLKARRSILSGLVNTSNTPRQEFDRKTGDYISVPAVRRFNFNEVLKEIDNLQDAIDEIDAAIQYVDATYTID